jgi:AcrR family transcriptional regulator
MPYSAEHREQTRKQIVHNARRLFNRQGFNGVSIDDVMAAAGLTRGGFYKYFESKSKLYAEAVLLILSEGPVTNDNGGIACDSPDFASYVIRTYLSRQHFEDIDAGCPLVALPGDVARSDTLVKQAFETVFKAMTGIFEGCLTDGHRGDSDRALAIASLCIGAMVVARSLEDRALADKLRDTAVKFAHELGNWK